jgi:hypothetical protein
VAQRSMKVSENQEYFTSDRWKCSKSPSGAHHWIIKSDQMTCKYCDFCKPMDMNRYGKDKPENK